MEQNSIFIRQRKDSDRMYGSKKSGVSVVIAAAGKGSRMGSDINKQYMEVLGKPILARTLQAFEDCSSINEVVITTGAAEIEYCRENIVGMYGFSKVSAITAGGASRQQSVYNGLQRVSEQCGIVLIHDGARPFIDAAGIEACIEAAEKYGAACAAVPVKDTIKRTDQGGFVNETVDRRSLWSIQTPQAFQYGLILEAHRKAMADGFEGTDDAVLAERLGHQVRLVMCSYYNIKITTGEDLIFAEAICRLKR